MITKGIVEEINNYSVKVRMPTYDAIEGAKEATENKDLSYATICTLPNASNLVNKGDIVFVGFEDNDLGKPIILGHLFKQNKSDTYIDLDLRKLNVWSSTSLTKDTSIGDVKSTEIAYLKGLKSNIQEQINNLSNLYINTESKQEINSEKIFNDQVTFNGKIIANNQVTFNNKIIANNDLIFSDNMKITDNGSKYYTNYIKSGTLDLDGSFSALNNIGGGFRISDPVNVGIELGRVDGTAGTPYIDFHNDGKASTDYNSRIINIANALQIYSDKKIELNPTLDLDLSTSNNINAICSTFNLNGANIQDLAQAGNEITLEQSAGLDQCTYRFANGLQICFGFVKHGSGNTAVNLIKPFKNTSSYIVLESGGKDEQFSTGFGTKNYSASSFNLRYGTTTAVLGKWIAIGWWK